MRIVLGIFLGLVCAIGLWLLVEPRGAQGSSPPAVAPLPDRDPARFAELEARIVNAENELQRLSLEVAKQGTAARMPATAPATFVATPADVKASGEGIDPRWYLEQYARSFDSGGGGSEYFRLAVDAYAPQLLGEICALVRDPNANPMLRAQLAAMLGTPRFARNTFVVDALFALLRESNDLLATAALTALRPIGDAQTGIALERLVWTLRSGEVKKRALELIVQLDGPDANRALQRLLASALTTDDRVLVVTFLSTADPDAALEVFRQASMLEDPVRLRAAHAIHKFRGEAFLAFIGQWLDYERDAQVRAALGEARSKMSQPQPYSAQKATGAPDAQPDQDHPNAWASKNPDMGLQWLDLGYKPARRAGGLRIHEVNVAGAVVQVLLFDESGRRHEVWAGNDPTTRPGVFEISFAATAYRVRTVRIVLDTNKSPGWSEIDAVELVGPDGNAWATEANASSSYGQ